MNKQSIFVVTCFYIENKDFLKNGNKISPRDFTRRVEWGFFHEYETALNCVKENWTDLYENGYYNMVRLEERNPGITSFHLDKHYWFYVEFNSTEDSYKIDFIPDCFFKKEFSYNFQKELKK